MLMNPKSLRLFAVLAFAFVAAAGAFAAEPAIIAKARARLGSDAVLEGVKTIHYVGTLSVADSSDPKKVVTQSIEIYLQKPDRQRIVVSGSDVSDVSVLDGYDAWRRVTNLKTKQWTQNVLAAADIKQQRADVWENLSYYRGIEKVKGWIVDQGSAKIDGVDCEKLAFYHSDALVYFRYFDRATGRLVMTGTEANSIKEVGEVTVAGIRFPHTMVIANKYKGQVQTQTITFEKITVNETFPDSLFAMPLATVP